MLHFPRAEDRLLMALAAVKNIGLSPKFVGDVAYYFVIFF